MGLIPQLPCLGTDPYPRHLGLMVLQGHGVGDDLKAVHQRAVVLTVDAVILGLGIANVQDLLGVVLVLAALVDLQLHAEVAFSGTEEVEFGNVVVVMDGLAVQDVVAMLAVGNVVQIIHVVGAVIVDELTATAAVGVVILVAPVPSLNTFTSFQPIPSFHNLLQPILFLHSLFTPTHHQNPPKPSREKGKSIAARSQ